MKKLKICVYAICKNEEKFVDAWMDSMSEADEVIVTDTGSEDGTVQKLLGRGATVYTEEIKPWRFDAARNRSLDHVPEDADICVCTDLDELFEPGWRRHLEKAWNKSRNKKKEKVARTGRYIYNWSLKEDGSPDTQFYYFKVHERFGFRWKCPVHEYVQYVGPLPLEIVYIDQMVLNHYPDRFKSRGSYLPLLELAVQEDPYDQRMRYYLGREYLYKGEWEKCIHALRQYLSMPNSRWNEERAAAMRWIAVSYENLGNAKEVFSWYFRAIAEVPSVREAYVEFAQWCYKIADWPMTFFLAQEALKIKEKTKTFVNMGYAWDYTPDDLCAISAYRLNMKEKALFHAKAALAYDPDNERLIQNLKSIEAALEG